VVCYEGVCVVWRYAKVWQPNRQLWRKRRLLWQGLTRNQGLLMWCIALTEREFVSSKCLNLESFKASKAMMNIHTVEVET